MNADSEKIPFEDNQGRVIQLPADMRLAELVKMGLLHIELEPIGTPLKDGWYGDVSKQPLENKPAPKDEFGIVANVGEPDSCLRLGAKCWIVGGTGGEGFTRFVWFGMTRGGRSIEKWCVTERFQNFRAAFIPPPIRSNYPDKLYLSGTRPEMEEIAKQLNEYRAGLRPMKPKSTLPKDESKP